MVPHRYGQMDGRLTIAIPRFALRASRGKNTFRKITDPKHPLLSYTRVTRDASKRTTIYKYSESVHIILITTC